MAGYEDLLNKTQPGDGDELMKNLEEMSPLDQSVGADTDELLGLKVSGEETEKETGQHEEKNQTGTQETKTEDGTEKEEKEEKPEVTGKEAKPTETEEGGVEESDLDALIEKHLQDRTKPDEAEDKRRKLLLGAGGEQTQQTQQTQQTHEESELAPIDFERAKKTLVDKLGDEYKEVADALQIYVAAIVEQTPAHMEAIASRVLNSHINASEQVRNSYASLAESFYEAYPDLATPAARKLVMANINELNASGRQFENDGAFLYEVGQITTRQIEDMKAQAGGGNQQQKNTRTQNKSLGKNNTRTKPSEEDTSQADRSVSDKSRDALFDHYSKKFAETGVSGHIN